MYWGRCPAKRGAVAKPFAEVPWHQVQFRTASGSPPPASVGTATETIASNAILILVGAAICSPSLCMRIGRCVAELSQITQIGRQRFYLRLAEVVSDRDHDGCRLVGCRTLPAISVPSSQLRYRVLIELACQARYYALAPRFRAMAGGACRHIGFGNSVLVDLLACGHPVSWSAAEGRRI